MLLFVASRFNFSVIWRWQSAKRVSAHQTAVRIYIDTITQESNQAYLFTTMMELHCSSYDSNDSDSDGIQLEDNEQQVVEFDLEALRTAETQQRDEGITAAVLRKNRAVMTILHFVLTYPQWSVSLFLLLASLTTPLPTAHEQVWRPVQQLNAVAQMESALYYQCVQSGFTLQDVHMDRAVALEEQRVQQERSSIQRQLRVAADATSQCFNSTLAAQRALQAWGTSGQTVPKTFNDNNIKTASTTCSVDDQGRLADILAQDVSAAQSSVQSILDAYVQASLAGLQKILLYSQERSAYDYDYFVGVKIQAVFQLLDHFAAPNLFLTFPEQRLILELRGILQGLLDALNGAYARIDVLAIRIAEFDASIHAFYVNYVDLYGRFELIGNFVGDFLPPGVTLPAYFDISGVPLPSALLPQIFSVPVFDGVLPNIGDLVSEYIVKALELISRLLEEAAVEASDQTRQIIDELLQQLKEILILENYDPPKYPKSPGIETPADEVAHLDNLAMKTKADASDALDELNKIRNNIPQFDSVKPNAALNTTGLGQKDLTSFSFLNLSFPEFAIPVWILTIFGYILSRTFLIECTTQAVRLFLLKRKYERNATPDLPEIDYLSGTERETKDQDKESKPSYIDAARAMLLKLMFNPWVMMGLMIIPCILVILIFWFPYVKRTCIDSRRGTFLARNVFKQIQVNKANSQGYGLHTEAQLQCNRRQRTICSIRSTESDSVYRNDVATLFSLQSRYNESASTRGVIERCVDADILDGKFRTHCCGLEGYAMGQCSSDQQPEFCPIDVKASPPASFRPVGELLLEPACDVDINSLNITGAIFNCSVLEETCNDVPCSGVDADYIGDMTIEADCSAEIYAIQLCIFIVLAVYHAIMINVANTLMFNGILQVRWRSLCPDGIKMVTHINTNGELVRGGDLQDRTNRVDKAMKRFVLSGYIQIGLSGAVAIFWLITFLISKWAAARLVMYHA